MRKLSVRVGYIEALFVFSTVIMVAACYAVAIPLRQIDAESFYLSYIFKQDPGRAISSFAIPVVAVSSYAIFLTRFLKAEISTSARSEGRLRWIRYLSSCACISLIGLGAVTIHTLQVLHGLFAFVMFTSSSISMMLMAVEDYETVYGRFTWLVLYRLTCASIAMIAILLMLYGFTMDKFVASVAELVFVLCMLLSLTSYRHELSGHSIEISLVRDDNSRP